MAQFATEEEKKAFEKGVEFTKRYIAHCIAVSLPTNVSDPDKFRIDATMTLMQVSKFVQGESDSIYNKENLSFSQFCEKYHY